MKLILGVEDIGYTAGTHVTTTGKVARILEDQYHVMETFYELHRKAVDAAVADAFKQAVDAVGAGREPALKLGISRIKMLFSEFIDSGEWEHVSGQRIEAAHHRHRIKHKDGSTEMSRSSDRAFVRTGQYRDSFRAWIEGR